MMKKMSRSTLMKNAWVIARKKANELGGKAVEYISYGLKKAWELYFEFTGKKRSADKKEQNIDWSQVKLYGRMTEKQERFIASLLAQGKYTDNPIVKAFQISSLRSKISKKQASELISELLGA